MASAATVPSPYWVTIFVRGGCGDAASGVSSTARVTPPPNASIQIPATATASGYGFMAHPPKLFKQMPSERYHGDRPPAPSGGTTPLICSPGRGRHCRQRQGSAAGQRPQPLHQD